MKIKENFFLKKKILIYGLGISGVSCFNFLKKQNHLNVYDDNFLNNHKKYKSYYLSSKKIIKQKFDYIFLSPGININKCNLTDFLLINKKKNNKRIRYILQKLSNLQKNYNHRDKWKVNNM